MRRASVWVLLALALGVGMGEFLTHSFSARRWIGHVVRRGELQALVSQRGIYDGDVERTWRSELFANGTEARKVEPAVATEQKRAVLQGSIQEEKVTAAAASESVKPAPVEHDTQLLRDQFRDEKTWLNSLANAGLTTATLKREVATNLRDRTWLEKQIAGQIQPNDSDVQRYYAGHQSAFQEPLRLRASHLFLAAPEGYPDEVINAKRTLIEELAKRLANGESFPALVAQFSEDEATKKRDGDLGYFSEARMLPAVFAAAKKLQPGQISDCVRSRLGFHILRLTEARPARQLSLDEARPEIIAFLENQRRAVAVASVFASEQAR
ncbi:MAG TPA: peptidylprolyl isomerase [Chthoniobacterales bacterium]